MTDPPRCCDRPMARGTTFTWREGAVVRAYVTWRCLLCRRWCRTEEE